MSSTDDLISAKELASKLKVTEPLLKKLIKDFEINSHRVDRRVYLDSKSATTVKEILALRASGKKNSEIKEMFDASQMDIKQDQSKEKAVETVSEPEELIVESPEPVQEADSSEKESRQKDNRKKHKKFEKKKHHTDAIDPKPHDEHKQKREEREASRPAKESNKTNSDGFIDIASYLQEDEEENELNELLKLEEGDEDIASLNDDEADDEMDSVTETEEVLDDTISPRKIRRRQFSFKYIQRQIANDSKRVNYIKQKLKRGRISTKERMILEDSLNHRSVLLSGWIQLLRWVKN